MWTIFRKDIAHYFSQLIAYIVVGVFILVLGLLMWVFPDFSILYYNYASLDQLFSIAPILFAFIIPALTMRSFSEEIQFGTLETLITKPLSEYQIVLGKYFAGVVMAMVCLIPSLLYYYSVYELGSPKGNIDSGAVLGSYLGLIMLSSSFVSIGIFGSAISKNQVSAFLISTFICFALYYGFYYLSKLPFFFGSMDDLIQRIGMDFHYNSISKGYLDSRDIIYFLSVNVFFLYLTNHWLKNRLFS
ncbi:MAG: gliding motility-associated ABC transporter permease subunit GldF [Saprospiraceae bacterium]|nr:gliding motility-associated ABC transporter permease subunit GldF [Saprospiraceae bacterium]